METKNGESLAVPLTEQAIEILLQRRKLNKEVGLSSVFVFPGTGVEGHLADPKKSWKKICRNATFKLWRLDGGLLKLLEPVHNLFTR